MTVIQILMTVTVLASLIELGRRVERVLRNKAHNEYMLEQQQLCHNIDIHDSFYEGCTMYRDGEAYNMDDITQYNAYTAKYGALDTTTELTTFIATQADLDWDRYLTHSDG